ncbi:lanthionine synthetase C family protein [Fodinicola acaciae]|uniref:lanthionine synthetase C family protein n=1 Tax=Fodinicola acaciae TaxID=2681555 RepID=UPI0013D74CE0|nr:lanthionine synthetase C family protein [Fodinicola acaciae]
MTTGDRAADVVTEIARRLADPARVAEIASDDAVNTLDGPHRIWTPLGLSDAFPGVALLFAELAATDRAYRRQLDAYLAASLAEPPAAPPGQLYDGVIALAFAIHLAHRGRAEPALLARLDEVIAQSAVQQAHAVRDRLSWSSYDLVSGPTGVGRYLLARGRHEALREVLTSLVAIALAPAGERTPWWVGHGHLRGVDSPGGHLNLGVAHGVGGPLGLLSLAWLAGVRVDAHQEAMGALVAILDSVRREDTAGPYWPAVVERPGQVRRRGRDMWCYGSAGLARILQFAAAAAGEPRLAADAEAAMLGALASTDPARVHDFALCHGWSGLLQLTLRTGVGEPEPLAQRIIDGFDPDTVFGFRYGYPGMTRPADRPGFLEGAAGIALALHAYGQAPATDWDAALLLC